MNEDNIQEFCEQAGYDYMGDYSGRGMFGRICPAIRTGKGASPTQVIAELMEYIMEADWTSGEKRDLKRAVKSAATDQLGLGYVVYFPALATD